MADNTASGIPLDVVDIQTQTFEQETQKGKARKARTGVAPPAQVEEVTAVSVRQTVDDEHDHEEDELDQIVDAVLQALQERRQGKSSSRRAARESDLSGPPAVMENPSDKTNKMLVYTGIGLGSAALIGGLWWYFNKK